MPERKALRWWHLSLSRFAPLVFAVAAACGGLDPIVASGLDGGSTSDGSTSDGSTSDGSTSDGSTSDGSADAAPADAGAKDASSDAIADASDAATPFPCGTAVCDARTHYCEKKGAGDGGPKGDAAAEVDTCIPLPVSCVDDGGVPTCGCIVEPCTCNQTGASITVTCP